MLPLQRDEACTAAGYLFGVNTVLLNRIALLLTISITITTTSTTSFKDLTSISKCPEQITRHKRCDAPAVMLSLLHLHNITNDTSAAHHYHKSQHINNVCVTQGTAFTGCQYSRALLSVAPECLTNRRHAIK
jgi:hypothetical protein